MLDKFDYLEPVCHLCGGADFYNPKKDAPEGRIPVPRILDKADALFAKNDYTEAGRLLEYWRDEAVALKDKSGELSMENELVGFYRKQNDSENGLKSVMRALELAGELEQENFASGATVILNCATAYNAFGMPEEALPLYLSAEMIYEDILEEGDARFGGLYNNMATTLSNLGYFSDAEKAYLSALRIMESIDGREADSAITYINLAHMYEEYGREEKISACIENAKKLLEDENLPHNGYYAFVIEKCAPSFEHFGDAETADKMRKESQLIYAGN